NHEKDAVAAPDAEPAQPVGDLRRASRELRERARVLAAVLSDDPERQRIVSGGERVEVVEGPVERREPGPAEFADGRQVVETVREEEVAGAQELVASGRHDGPDRGSARPPRQSRRCKATTPTFQAEATPPCPFLSPLSVKVHTPLSPRGRAAP